MMTKDTPMIPNTMNPIPNNEFHEELVKAWFRPVKPELTSPETRSRPAIKITIEITVIKCFKRSP
tara:strand:- start:12199 stop:12393 length:195 start_codon:yes stop_codon:yes gene_type:complete